MSQKKDDLFANHKEKKKPDWRGPVSLVGGFLIHLVLGQNLNKVPFTCGVL